VLNGGVANALCACGQLTQVLSHTFVITGSCLWFAQVSQHNVVDTIVSGASIKCDLYSCLHKCLAGQ